MIVRWFYGRDSRHPDAPNEAFTSGAMSRGLFIPDTGHLWPRNMPDYEIVHTPMVRQQAEVARAHGGAVMLNLEGMPEDTRLVAAMAFRTFCRTGTTPPGIGVYDTPAFPDPRLISQSPLLDGVSDVWLDQIDYIPINLYWHHHLRDENWHHLLDCWERVTENVRSEMDRLRLPHRLVAMSQPSMRLGPKESIEQGERLAWLFDEWWMWGYWSQNCVEQLGAVQ